MKFRVLAPSTLAALLLVTACGGATNPSPAPATAATANPCFPVKGACAGEGTLEATAAPICDLVRRHLRTGTIPIPKRMYRRS